MQPQTKEVLELARASGCAVVVGLTKVDKLQAGERQGARERVCNQLLELGWVAESYGGDVPMVEVSARSVGFVSF